MTGAPPEGGPTGPRRQSVTSPARTTPTREELLALVRTVDPTAPTRVLLIAHNPGVSLLSALLDPGGAADDGPAHRRAGGAPQHARLAGPGGTGAPIVERHTARD